MRLFVPQVIRSYQSGDVRLWTNAITVLWCCGFLAKWGTVDCQRQCYKWIRNRSDTVSNRNEEPNSRSAEWTRSTPSSVPITISDEEQWVHMYLCLWNTDFAYEYFFYPRFLNIFQLWKIPLICCSYGYFLSQCRNKYFDVRFWQIWLVQFPSIDGQGAAYEERNRWQGVWLPPDSAFSHRR